MCKNEYFIIANINSFEMVTFLLKVLKNLIKMMNKINLQVLGEKIVIDTFP